MNSRIMNGLAAVVAAAALAGCATTSVKGKMKSEATVWKNIDWQGAELGKEIPEWVSLIADQNKEELAKLPEMKGKVPYVNMADGNDIDLLKIWGDTGATANLSNEISTTFTASAGGIANGNKDDEEATIKMVEAINTALSNTKFSGFRKERSFWVQMKNLEDGSKKYRYYVLYSIDKENLDNQIDVALGKISAKTAKEQEMLDKMRQQGKITMMSSLGIIPTGE